MAPVIKISQSIRRIYILSLLSGGILQLTFSSMQDVKRNKRHVAIYRVATNSELKF